MPKDSYGLERVIYYTNSDPILASTDGINPNGPANRPILNLEQRDIDLYNLFKEVYLRYKPTPDNPVSDKVIILPGTHTKSDRSGIVRVDNPTPITIEGNVSSGKVRYDLIQVDDTGTISVKKGEEKDPPGNPYTDTPPLDVRKLAIAIIRITEDSGNVLVEENDIYDVREFLNLVEGSGITTSAGSSIYIGDGSTQTFSVGNDQPLLGTTLSSHSNSVFVYLNRLIQIEGEDYSFTDGVPASITFNTAPISGDHILIRYFQQLPIF